MCFGVMIGLSLILCLFLQIRFPIPVQGAYMHIPWMHAIVIYYALHHRLRISIVVALIASFLVDGYSLTQPGTTLLAYGLVIIIADRYRQLIVSDAAVTASVFGAGLGLGLCVLQVAALVLAGRQGLSALFVIMKLVLSVVFAAICTPCICSLMRALHRMLDLSELDEGEHVNA